MKKFLPIFFLLFVAFVTHYGWFLSSNNFFAGDWYLWNKIALKDFASSLWGTWFPFFDIGYPNIQIFSMPWRLIWALFSWINFDFNLIVKITFLFPITILSVLSPYFLLKKYLKLDELSSVIVSVWWSLIPYQLVKESGHLQIALMNVLLPLYFLFFISSIQSIAKTLLLALFSIILVSIEPRIFLLFIFIIFIKYFFQLLFSRSFRKLFIRQYFLNIFFFFIILGLLFSYTIFPMFYLITNINNTTSRLIFGSNLTGILSAITLTPWHWQYDHISFKFIPAIIPIIFYIPAIIAISSCLFIKNRLPQNEKYNIYYFTLLSLIGLLLSKSINPPFTSLYEFLYKKVPGFQFFRETTKLYLITMFGYFGLISYSIKYSYDKVIKYIIIGLLSLYILVVGIFTVNNSFSAMWSSKKIPVYYQSLNNLIKESGNIFCVPFCSKWINFNIVNQKINYLSFENYFSSEKNESFFDLANLKYIVLFKKYNSNEDEYNETFNKMNGKSLIKNYIKKININSWQLIEENNNYFFFTRKKNHGLVYRCNPTDKSKCDDLSYSIISPVEVRMHLYNTSELVLINFAQSYDFNWKIRVGEFDWFKVLTEKNYFIPNKYHYKNDAQLNSFLIDPAVVCSPRNPEPSLGTFLQSLHDKYLFISKFAPKAFWLRGKQYECKKNPDGSYDINLTLYFSPQSYFYLGLTISGLTLFGCLSYLVVYFVRSRKTKHPKHPKPLPQASTS